MADKDTRLIIKNSNVPGRIPSGTNGDEPNMIKEGELAINLADKKLYSYDGSEVFQVSGITTQYTGDSYSYYNLNLSKVGSLSGGDVINPPSDGGLFSDFGNMGHLLTEDIEVVQASILYGRMVPTSTGNSITISLREYSGGGQITSNSGFERAVFTTNNVSGTRFTQKQIVDLTGVNFTRNNILIATINSPLVNIGVDNVVINLRCKSINP